MKTARKTRGITQKEMAMAMNCTGSYLSHIEKLRRPIPHNFVKIVKDTINLSMAELQELNFLSNKAQKIKDIEYGTELDYALRKDIIREHYDQFISEKCKEL